MSDYPILFRMALRRSREATQRFFKFDSIHLHKIMEMSQYSLMAFCFALMGASFVNKMGMKHRPRLKVMSTSELFGHIMVMTLIIVILSRYIPKFVRIMPFLFHFDRNYAPDYKGEARMGIDIAMGLAFFTCIYNYYDYMDEITDRLFPHMFQYQVGSSEFCEKDGRQTIAYPTCKSFGGVQVNPPKKED